MGGVTVSTTTPTVEYFTDEHGRAAYRYLTADLEHGIAAGSEFLVVGL